jgi:hypothetical protein
VRKASSDRYSGELGQAYFDWQNSIGRAGGIIELQKFSKYIANYDVVLDFGCGGAPSRIIARQAESRS